MSIAPNSSDYTVQEGSEAVMTLVRRGNISSTIDVNVTTLSGSAIGT